MAMSQRHVLVQGSLLPKRWSAARLQARASLGLRENHFEEKQGRPSSVYAAEVTKIVVFPYGCMGMTVLCQDVLILARKAHSLTR